MTTDERTTCVCGQFEMPPDAAKIEARNYSVHTRAGCHWGQRDPIAAAVDAQLDPLKDELIAIGRKLEEQLTSEDGVDSTAASQPVQDPSIPGEPGWH